MDANFVVTQEFIESRPLSASSIKAFRKSPKHYLMYLKKPFVPSESMILGSVVDVLALTPEEFDKRFFVFQKATGTGSRAVNQKAKDDAAAKGLMLITPDQVETAKLCVESLYSHDISKQLLEHKKNVQRKLLWRNKENNLPLIGYQDFESNVWGDKFIVDLKTTRSADPDEFSRQAASLDYEIQAGAYLDAYHKKFYQFPYFIFLAVETSEPYNVSVNFCDTKYVERAKSEFYGSLKAFRYCMDNFPEFNIGYDFRLMGTMSYFSMDIPRYKKERFVGFEDN